MATLADGWAASGRRRPIVVGLGGSAGAIESLQQFFGALPDEPGAAFVVVMHLAPDKTSQLAEVLQSHTSLPVTQVTESVSVEPDHIYVVPPGHTLLMEDQILVPQKLEGEDERRFPIDRFFRSLARASVEPVGVVLSGSGTDGSVGLRAITEAGGMIAVQDPSETTHSSMPRSAIKTSRVDLVLPVGDLARRLGEQGDVALNMPEAPEEVLDEHSEVLEDIFEQVRARTGHDFSEYKRSTMLRRIHRRLQVHQISSLPEYVDYLKEDPSEAAALQKDMLIGVTSFFRNPDSFEALQTEVLPSIFEKKDRTDSVRGWIVGCATGEEAYSIGMLFLEYADKTDVPAEQIQLFATDIDEEALAVARKGRYPGAVAADVPERYLDRFFRREGTEYVVRKPLRERILFAPHSLLREPPFSNLDFITCRNLLIYLRRDLQRSVFDLFGYALNDEGYLFLGSSESVDLADSDFRVVDKSHRLYQRLNGGRSVPDLPAMPLAAPKETTSSMVFEEKRDPSEAALHRRLLEAYAPPSAIVDEDYTFVHLSQSAGRYLQHPVGPPNKDIVDIVRPELRVKLRSALREAFARGKMVRTQPVTVQFDEEERSVRLVVRPAQEVPEAEGLVLVVFLESEPTSSEDFDTERADGEVVKQLEAELEQTKKELRATVEEYETSKQEMRAANEELRSMNEEYKSMTEELETSKEELQSVNEELKTVNRELEDKVEELRESNNDLQNLMAATDIGTLFLDRDLYIQRYTPRIEELFSIQGTDTGRPIGDFTHRLDYEHLQADAREVLDDLAPVEREVRSEDGQWFLVRQHPYRTVEDRIEGVVITFVDITERKEAEHELRGAHQSLRERTEQVRSLSEALTAAEERERERISRVLHDDLQQTIFAARMRVDHLRDQTEMSEKQKELADRSIELLDNGIDTTRTLSSELSPPVGDQSLRDALEWLGIQMEESYDLTVKVDAAEAPVKIDKNLRILIFRNVRELLFNVVKHADVDEASLRVEREKDGFRVIVEDQGEGFDPSTREENQEGFGLVSVRDRIEMIGGRFEIESSPGEGTRVAIEIPWEAVELTDGE